MASQVTEAELNKLSAPYFRHVDTCGNCKTDYKTGIFKPCKKAVKLVDEFGRNVNRLEAQRG